MFHMLNVSTFNLFKFAQMDWQISSFFTRAIQFCILPLYLDVSDEICHYFAVDIFPRRFASFTRCNRWRNE